MILGKLEIYGAIALGLILAMVAAYWVGHHKGYAAEHALFVAFQTKTEAIGEQAKAAALLKEKADKLNKEKADAENVKTHAGLLTTIGRLRNANSGSGGLSAPAPATLGSDRICFDRTKFSAALRSFDQGVLGIVETGSDAVIDLDTAKKWGDGRLEYR